VYRVPVRTLTAASSDAPAVAREHLPATSAVWQTWSEHRA